MADADHAPLADGGDDSEDREDAAAAAAAGSLGDLSSPEVLEAVEVLLFDGPPVYTRVEVAKKCGVTIEVAEALWHSLGFAHAADDAVVFTEADVRALEQTMQLVRAGILDEESQAAMVRTWGRSFARLAEWQTSLLAGIAVASDDPEARMQELAGDVIPLVDALQSYIWRRHLFSASSRLLMRPSDTGELQAVGFVDIVGYTTQSKNLSDTELVGLVEHFEEVAASTVTDHGGQLIKTIGDEVLFVSDSAVGAARIARDLVQRHDSDELFPDVRAGVAYGGVVSRLGDVFGPTVNIASRLTSVARPGTVLVDPLLRDALLEADADEAEFRLRRVRRTSVKGYSRLEPWRLKQPKV
ncbi:MAG: adenylate/guanylate cyclase domain-containing protein [Marmoricola sp.]